MSTHFQINKVTASADTNHTFATCMNGDVLPDSFTGVPVVAGYRVVENEYDAGYWLSEADFNAKFINSGAMTFGEAIAIMQGGGKVTRTAWGDPTIYCQIQIVEEGGTITEPYIYMVKGASKFPLDLSSESVLAADWEEVV